MRNAIETQYTQNALVTAINTLRVIRVCDIHQMMKRNIKFVEKTKEEYN
jgi:hypothetical protein